MESRLQVSRIEAGTFPRQVIMVERIQVELVDDIDGSPAQDTVTFALDGVTYEIDLSQHHARALRSVLAKYIERARTPDAVARRSQQQEREERRTRQANRKLTEQIRGAAQRSRERLSKQAEQEQVPADADADNESQEQPVFSQPVSLGQERKPQSEDSRVPAVSLPQFFSAVD
jgi:hypothetical protein